MLWMLVASALASDWALVRAGADLFAAPDAAVPVTSVRWSGALLVEVASRRDGWVELRTRPEPPRTCKEGWGAPAAVELVLWAEEASLLPVLTRRVELVSGAVALPGWSPSDGVALEVWAKAQLPADAWGTVFQAASAVSPWEDWDLVDLDTFDGLVTVDGRSFTVANDRVRRVAVSPDLPGHVVIVSDDACLAVPAVAVNPLPEQAWGVVGGVVGGSLGPTAPPRVIAVAAGTSLSWVDGAPAGVTKQGIELYDPAQVGALVCGGWGMWAPYGPPLPGDVVRLCVSGTLPADPVELLPRVKRGRRAR